MPRIELYDLSDPDSRDLAIRMIMAGYASEPCPHCSKEFTGADFKPDGMIVSGIKGRAAHPHCFYVHEANEEWREDNPEAAIPPDTNPKGSNS